MTPTPTRRKINKREHWRSSSRRQNVKLAAGSILGLAAIASLAFVYLRTAASTDSSSQFPKDIPDDPFDYDPCSEMPAGQAGDVEVIKRMWLVFRNSDGEIAYLHFYIACIPIGTPADPTTHEPKDLQSDQAFVEITKDPNRRQIALDKHAGVLQQNWFVDTSTFSTRHK